MSEQVEGAGDDRDLHGDVLIHRQISLEHLIEQGHAFRRRDLVVLVEAEDLEERIAVAMHLGQAGALETHATGRVIGHDVLETVRGLQLPHAGHTLSDRPHVREHVQTERAVELVRLLRRLDDTRDAHHEDQLAEVILMQDGEGAGEDGDVAVVDSHTGQSEEGITGALGEGIRIH